MPVTITDRKYTHLGRPGDNNIDWLLGNVGVWQKLTLTCEFEVAINFSSTNVLFMEEPNIFTLGDGSEWREHGFEVGDSFLVKWATTDNGGTTQVYNVTGTIVSINGSEMRSSNGTLGLGAQDSNIYPYQGAEIKAHSVFIRADKRPQGIKFQYGHLKNSEADSINLKSFIDGTTTEFEAKDTHLMTIGQVNNFDFIGLQSGMSISSCKLKYIANQSAKYFYEIEVIFMISSFLDDLNNLLNGVSPEVTYNNACLTDNFIVIGYPTYNNPNIKIQNDPRQTKRLGNTGWLNENFNGLPNPFSVSSVTYTNSSSNTVSQLDYANPILVTAVIDGIQNLSSQTKCMFGFAWIPINEEEYKSQDQGNQYQTGFFQNLLMNTGGEAANFGDVFNVSNTIDPTLRKGYTNQSARMDVRNIRFQQTGVNQITFQAEFIPNLDFTLFMDAKDISERNYLLWVSVADQNETTNNADRVSLKLDEIRQLDTYIEPIGEFPEMEITFLDHTQDENSEPCPCGNDWRIEDEVLSMINFRIDTAQSSTIPIPTAITYGVIIKRLSDDYTYELDRYKIDLTQYPNPTQFNFDNSKGFKLPAGNNKNYIKVDYYPAFDVGTEKGVRGFYAFKIRWEDWLQRFGVSQEVVNDYYDNTKKANGLNNDWYNYLSNSDWNLYFVVYVDATLNGKKVRYENLKEIDFVDYDDNQNVSTEIRYYRHSDNTQLLGGTDPETGKPLGVILTNELVRIEIDYVLNTGTWGSISDIYGINTIEVFEGAGQLEYRQISTEYAPESDNPLLPIPGDTVLDMQIVNPNTLRCSCLVDYTKLIPASKYKITGREGCKGDDCKKKPTIYFSSTKNTTTNSSTNTKGLIAAVNVFNNNGYFTFKIDAKDNQGNSYIGDYEVTAQAFRKDGSMFNLGRAFYVTGQNANSNPALSDSTWNSWNGGLGLNSYFIGTFGDGNMISFRKRDFSLNNSDPDKSSGHILKNENAVIIKFRFVIKENCVPSTGEGGVVYLYQTAFNGLIGFTNGDWQTEAQTDYFLSGGSVGMIRDFYVDNNYLFLAYAFNETGAKAGTSCVILSEMFKNRDGSGWQNVWTYQDRCLDLAAKRGGYGTNTSAAATYGSQIDDMDSNNIHNGKQYPVMFSCSKGSADSAEGRKIFMQSIIGYTDGSDPIYNNTKGFPIFSKSIPILTGNPISPYYLHYIVSDWRENERPVILCDDMTQSNGYFLVNIGTYSSPIFNIVGTISNIGISGAISTMHYTRADGNVYCFFRNSSSSVVTFELHKIQHNGGSYADIANYSTTKIFEYSFDVNLGSSFDRVPPPISGNWSNYPFWGGTLVPHTEILVNGFPKFYFKDVFANCVVELVHNGGTSNDLTDWDYEIIAGTFGHASNFINPSRKNGFGLDAEFDFVGALDSTPEASIKSQDSRMYGNILYYSCSNLGHMVTVNVVTKEVFYLAGVISDGNNGALTLL